MTASERQPPVNDLRDLAGLVGHHADATVLRTTQGLHRAIAARAFRWSPGSTPVRMVHDTVSDLVYGSVRLGLRGGSLLGQAVAQLAGRGREVRWLEGTPARRRAGAILHGVIGDRFAADHPALERPMSIRLHDRTTPANADALRTAFPRPAPRVALFLHGLTESDRSWDGSADDVVLPDVVADLGWTPLRLRYGTGRAIGTSGSELDELLETLVAVWPVPVTELALVGHSMGGLVIRAAAQHAATRGHRWPDLVRHTVSLGTPHLGSWLERAANRGTRLLRRVPEGAVVADVIDTRARGIKDLRHGALSDACWGDGVVADDGIGGLDGDLPPPTSIAPLIDGAVHHLVAGHLTTAPDSRIATLIGDALVTASSALGDHERRGLRGGRIETLTIPAGHDRLMRDPRVADHLRRWLA